MRNVTLAATEMACSWDIWANVARGKRRPFGTLRRGAPGWS